MEKSTLLVSEPQGAARLYSGYDKFAWDRFLLLTRDETARKLAIEFSKSWAAVPINRKNEYKNYLNAKLEQEGMSEASDELITWRMSQVLRKINTQAPASPADTNSLVGTPDPPSREIMTESTVTTESRTHLDKPYDPVRDL